MQITKELLRKEALAFGQRIQNDQSFPYKEHKEALVGANSRFLDRLEKADGKTYEEISAHTATVKEALEKKTKLFRLATLASAAVAAAFVIAGSAVFPPLVWGTGAVAGVLAEMASSISAMRKGEEAASQRKFLSQLQDWKEAVESSQKPAQQGSSAQETQPAQPLSQAAA